MEPNQKEPENNVISFGKNFFLVNLELSCSVTRLRQSLLTTPIQQQKEFSPFEFVSP